MYVYVSVQRQKNCLDLAKYSRPLGGGRGGGGGGGGGVRGGSLNPPFGPQKILYTLIKYIVSALPVH